MVIFPILSLQHNAVFDFLIRGVPACQGECIGKIRCRLILAVIVVAGNIMTTHAPHRGLRGKGSLGFGGFVLAGDRDRC